MQLGWLNQTKNIARGFGRLCWSWEEPIFSPNSKGFHAALCGVVININSTKPQDWIAAAGLTEGYLFRGIIHKTGQLRPSYNDPKKPDLSDQTVALVVKKYNTLIGLDHENYAGHSLRAGFVTAARKNGASYEQIMEVTGHKDLKSLIMYFRNIDQYKDHAGEGLL